MQRPPRPRTAFVTGASAGIGRALAERLAERGTTVALAARRKDLLDDVRAAIEAKGGRAVVVPVDVSRPEEVVAAMERTDDELGGIELVIANAGIGGNMHATKMTWAQIAPIFQLNVMGAIATLTALLPRMSARGRGHLVGVSSLAGMRGLPKTAPYSATKAALSTFLESLHVDLDGSGIFVTDVRPGYVKTDLTAGRSYKMPMLMELSDATDTILGGIDAGEPIVAFPKPLAAVLSATRVLSRAGYVQLARKLVKR
ncbi:MAG: SDR family NAD(P)-dependent oxidoreductase [Polyangiales bacterium]